MKYIHYTVEDFIKDEYFQKWVLDTDNMTSNFWNNWMVKYPEKKTTIEEAKKFILLMDFDKDKLSDADFDSMWQHIIEKRNTKHTTSQIVLKGKLKTLYWKYAAVASVLFIVTLTVFLNKENNLPQVIEPIIVNSQIKTGSIKATLTLADGSDVTLEKDQVYKSSNVTSNGEEIVYNKKPTKKIIYNYLTIPRGGQFSIKLSDGTQVWLNSDTKLKYPVSFIDGQARMVELVYGEAYFDVSKSTNHNGSNFKVKTRMQETEVLGTEFNIKAYQDENDITTTLVEGKVKVGNGIVSKFLKPSEQSLMNIKGQDIIIQKVNRLFDEIAWKEGYFNFKQKSMKEIMKILSRWYDIDYTFKDSEKERKTFTGVLNRESTIDQILIYIQKTNEISFQINNKTVIIE